MALVVVRSIKAGESLLHFSCVNDEIENGHMFGKEMHTYMYSVQGSPYSPYSKRCQ